MRRVTGSFRVTNIGGESVRAFVPLPLPPARPSLAIEGLVAQLLTAAESAIGRLDVAAQMVPSVDWFLYGFVRKEAVISSQIEGTQATLRDVLEYEATERAQRPDDVREVSNYVDALLYARREMKRPAGLPLSTRLLCEAHKRLMRGTRGAEKQPGQVRRSQNWIGGTRPGNAVFVPPPADEVPELMSALERWLHADDGLPPLVRAGLAHAQFETIHPFLDGNGRIGRLLVTLLMEHWGLLSSPLLYLSLPLKRRRDEYYRQLTAVRSAGDFEGWSAFFLESVRDAADDAVAAAQRLFAVVAKDRKTLLTGKGSTIAAIRLFDLLPMHPIVTLSRAMKLLKTTKPTAAKAIDALRRAKILRETTGKPRDRVYAYQGYLHVLTKDTLPIQQPEA